MPTPLRLVKAAGTRYWLRIYWGDERSGVVAAQHKDWSYHNAQKFLKDGPLILTPEGWHSHEGEARDYPNEADWPTNCDICGAIVPPGQFMNDHNPPGAPANPIYELFSRTLYVAEGEHGFGHELAPGDVFDAFWMEAFGETSRAYEGSRLGVVLPNGNMWHNGRATNCTHYPKDQIAPGDHCDWTVTGTLPKITVRASILSGNWHGFITDGVLDP